MSETTEDPARDWTLLWECNCGTKRVNLGWSRCEKCHAVSPMHATLDAEREQRMQA